MVNAPSAAPLWPRGAGAVGGRGLIFRGPAWLNSIVRDAASEYNCNPSTEAQVLDGFGTSLAHLSKKYLCVLVVLLAPCTDYL